MKNDTLRKAKCTGCAKPFMALEWKINAEMDVYCTHSCYILERKRRGGKTIACGWCGHTQHICNNKLAVGLGKYCSRECGKNYLTHKKALFTGYTVTDRYGSKLSVLVLCVITHRCVYYHGQLVVVDVVVDLNHLHWFCYAGTSRCPPGRPHVVDLL